MTPQSGLQGWFDGVGVVLIILMIIVAFATFLGLVVRSIFGTGRDATGVAAIDTTRHESHLRHAA
ncbi:MAG TPA: hypothetical protein VFS39_13620 [Nitrospira sp.]|nr:hypothetical protein [Nitrospira sp.]